MTKVYYTPKVYKELETLAVKLYNMHYFGFESSAVEYVRNLKDFIETKIETAPKRLSKSKTKFYNKYQFFITYKANKNTTWYIYFVEENGKYIITHIDNNHNNPSIRSL